MHSSTDHLEHGDARRESAVEPGQPGTAEAMPGHDMNGGGGHEHAEHDRHGGHSAAMVRDKFWLSLLMTGTVVIWSPDIQLWFSFEPPSFPGSEFIPAIFGTAIFFYGGAVFLRGARGELAQRQPGMMTLISMAIVVAFVVSWMGTLGIFELEIWWELSTLIVIMLFGHWMEMRSIAQARGALDALAELLPDTAERVAGSDIEEVPLSRQRKLRIPIRAAAPIHRLLPAFLLDRRPAGIEPQLGPPIAPVRNERAVFAVCDQPIRDLAALEEDAMLGAFIVVAEAIPVVTHRMETFGQLLPAEFVGRSFTGW